jgi:3-isopropylmalate/(R)-2-methylmalate dehydratase small subunit
VTPFTTLTSMVADLTRDNVDTDTIIPSREMRSTGKTGLAGGLFAPWRYLDAAARTPNPDFVLNRAEYAGAQILSSGLNFGCGSSREHAVWALAEYGIRCVIAESFAPIFYNNCLRNGVLPIALSHETISKIAGRTITIDLMAQMADDFHFEIDAEPKEMLLEGLDVISLTLKSRGEIEAWTERDRGTRPWVYLPLHRPAGGPPPHPLDREERAFPLQSKIGEGDHAKHGGGVKKLPPKTNAAIMRAKTLRRSLSPPEARLWTALNQRPGGLKFRKQHPAPPYTLDFYCAQAALCIEVDGISHDMGNNPQRDTKRDAYLAEHGIKTLRFPALAIKNNLEGVVESIVLEAKSRIPLHHPADGPPPHSANGEER